MKMLRSMGSWRPFGGWMLAGCLMWTLGGRMALSQKGSGNGGSGNAGVNSAPPGTAPQTPPTPQLPSLTLEDAGEGTIEQQQAKLRNMERQRQLVDDTQKLLALANELKVDVEKSNKNMLSLDVVRKADEIEKLAHNVKEKMKGT